MLINLLITFILTIANLSVIYTQKAFFELSNLNTYFKAALTIDDLNFIERIVLHNSGSRLEYNGRRVIALLCVKENMQDYELFANFILSSTKNAPLFSHNKLILFTQDDKVATFSRYHGL